MADSLHRLPVTCPNVRYVTSHPHIFIVMEPVTAWGTTSMYTKVLLVSPTTQTLLKFYVRIGPQGIGIRIGELSQHH